MGQDADHDEALGAELASLERVEALSGLPLGPDFGPVAPGHGGWLIKASTQEAYRARAEGLWRAAALRKARLCGDLEAPALIKPLEVVHYLKWRTLPQGDTPALSISTWRSYRSALLWDFARSKQPEFAQAQAALEALAYDNRPTDASSAKQAEAHAGRKLKDRRGIPKSDLNRLIDQLGAMNRHMKWGARVQYWLQAAIATGLRPREWEHARWADESQTLLLAPTLKVKADTPGVLRKHRSAQARSDGSSAHQEPPTHLQMRAIAVDASEQMFVAQHMHSIRQAAEMGFNFEEYQTYCRQTLWRACRRLWDGKKLYSLYQCRHQFSANARGKMSRDELTRVMGHKQRHKTMSYYAGAQWAHSKSPIAQRLAHAHGQGQGPEAERTAAQSQAMPPLPLLSQPAPARQEHGGLSDAVETA